MKLESYNKLKTGATNNIKIKHGIQQLVKEYQQDYAFSKYTREDIYEVVVEQCIEDCNNSSNEMLGFTLYPYNKGYLNQLLQQNKVPVWVEENEEVKIK
jgi:hypothetical protein